MISGPFDGMGTVSLRAELTYGDESTELRLLLDTGALGLVLAARRVALPALQDDLPRAPRSVRHGVGGPVAMKRVRCTSLRLLDRNFPRGFVAFPDADLVLGASPFGEYDGLLGMTDLARLADRLTLNFTTRRFGLRSQ